jgi:ABC-type multidrug transport system ATPase subunit
MEKTIQLSDLEAELPSMINSGITEPTINLTFEQLSYEIPVEAGPLHVLKDVSGEVQPGEVLAILGPSGGGKTSLLNVLAGRATAGSKVSGSIKFNGEERVKGMKRAIAYVLQDDVLFPNLTVLETLRFTAELRLPGPSSERMKMVNQLLVELNLTHVQNTIIGRPFQRGVSGGERKRTNIANELLTNPKLILLDEPTSGLDSASAYSLMCSLKQLARTHHSTIISSIHQPSSQVYETFDRMMLMVQGRVLYFGHAMHATKHFAAQGYACPATYNPADFLLGVVTKPRALDAKDDGKDEKYDALVAQLANAHAKSDSRPQGTEARLPLMDYGAAFTDEKKWSTSWWHQFMILSIRSSKQQRGETVSWIEIGNILAITTVVAGLWWQTAVDANENRIKDLQGYVFFTSVFWGFWPMFNALTTFPSERSVLVKERASGCYRLSAYFAAKTCSDVPLYTLMPTIYAVITFHCLGLHHGYKDVAATLSNLLVFIVVLLLNVLTAQSFGLFISTAVMDFKTAMVTAQTTMLTFMLAGGFYLDSRNIPDVLSFIPAVSFVTYSYPALMINTFRETPLSFACVQQAGAVSSTFSECPVTGPTVLSAYGIEGSVGEKVAVLLAMMVSFRAGAYLFLRYRWQSKGM